MGLEKLLKILFYIIYKFLFIFMPLGIKNGMQVINCNVANVMTR